MTGLESVAAATISSAYLFGMVVVLLENLRAALGKQLQVEESQVDWLLATLNLALVPMMLAAGMLADRFETRAVLVIGSLMTALAIFFLAQSRTLLAAGGSILLIGVGGACLSTGSSLLMSSAFFPNYEVASQNLGNVFFALGALTAPPLGHWSLARLGFRRGVGAIALLCLVPGLLAGLTAPDAFPPSAGASAQFALTVQNPIVWLAGLVFLLYLPLEGSLGTWSLRYLGDLGFGERRAAWLLAGFWLAFLAARLLAALVGRTLITGGNALGGILVILALGAAVCLGNMAGARQRLSGGLGLLLVGACFGPIFPTLVGLLFEHLRLTYARPERGTAYGTMFAIGALGNVFLLRFINMQARKFSVQRALRIPMMLALALTLSALVLVLFAMRGG
jgi:fucose permease